MRTQRGRSVKSYAFRPSVTPISILFALSIFSSTPVQAQSEDLFAIQMRLKTEGHYAGKIDGLSGPATRNALEEYSRKHGVPDDVTAVAGHIRLVRVPAESQAPDQELMAKAREYVKLHLTDPESAQFRNDFTYKVADYLIYCGEVNSKNTFGGYVGFAYFHATIIESRVGSSRILLPAGNPLRDSAELFCTYGVSAMAFAD